MVFSLLESTCCLPYFLGPFGPLTLHTGPTQHLGFAFLQGKRTPLVPVGAADVVDRAHSIAPLRIDNKSWPRRRLPPDLLLSSRIVSPPSRSGRGSREEEGDQAARVRGYEVGRWASAMALKFLNKKGWHTGSLRNIERVWKAEQAEEAEKRKTEELKKQVAAEKEKAEFRAMQERAGLRP